MSMHAPGHHEDLSTAMMTMHTHCNVVLQFDDLHSSIKAANEANSQSLFPPEWSLLLRPVLNVSTVIRIHQPGHKQLGGKEDAACR